MDTRGDPQGCSGDFSATSPLSHRHDRSASRTIPTEKTGRQKSASHHPYLSEDNTRNGAAPVPRLSFPALSSQGAFSSLCLFS